MNRFIVRYLTEKGVDVIVVEAKTLFRAKTKVRLIATKYRDFDLLSIRTVYNPKYSIVSSWFFEGVDVPEKYMNKYLYWDNKPESTEIIWLD